LRTVGGELGCQRLHTRIERIGIEELVHKAKAMRFDGVE
jgi:hypothetical protein